MPKLKYFEPEIMSLERDPDMNETWLQERIAANPKILGLGDLILKDKERPQPRAGRLDLLLQDPESLRRYEVEVQLGDTDASHIIRTIEYWDIERRRYPQYDHCAVIVAEKVTGRFLNVIGLFNGFIPLIAIQMVAVRVENKIGLIFTKVLDEFTLGLLEEDEEEQEPTDRAYWEKKGSTSTVELVDRTLRIIQSFAPDYELKYNKHYIGMVKNSQANNFVTFRPQKAALRLSLSCRGPRKRRVCSKKMALSYSITTISIRTIGFAYHPRTYRPMRTCSDSSCRRHTRHTPDVYHLLGFGRNGQAECNYSPPPAAGT